MLKKIRCCRGGVALVGGTDLQLLVSHLATIRIAYRTGKCSKNFSAAIIRPSLVLVSLVRSMTWVALRLYSTKRNVTDEGVRHHVSLFWVTVYVADDCISYPRTPH